MQSKATRMTKSIYSVLLTFATIAGATKKKICLSNIKVSWQQCPCMCMQTTVGPLKNISSNKYIYVYRIFIAVKLY